MVAGSLPLALALLCPAELPVIAQGRSSSATEEALASQNAYILGPGDQVQLIFFDPGAKDFGGTFEILNDGSASLALLGDVFLEGLTVGNASRWLRSIYKRYLRRPDLNLRVIRARPLQVSVVGEVESPGLYSLTGSEVSQTEGGASTAISGLPTVVTVIQKAGGLTLNADLRRVILQRRLPGDPTQLRETQLDLAALLRQGDKTQNPFLFDGDTILVATAPTPDREVIELAASNLSPQRIRVNVVGEVVQPGRLELQANTPVVQAILAAGGPKNWRARRSSVELVRINRNGTATREILPIDYSQGVSGLRNPPLRDGDTVVVYRSNYAVVTDALGAVTSPVSGLVNAWGLVRLVRGTY
jgi:polysaccharide export outer membrane protein